MSEKSRGWHGVTSAVECKNDEVQGWLKQKSKYLRAWRDRHIVFNTRTLKALRSKKVITDATRHLAQVIDLQSYTGAVAEGPTAFNLSHPSQPQLSFKASTPQSRDEWVRRINTALFNHHNLHSQTPSSTASSTPLVSLPAPAPVAAPVPTPLALPAFVAPPAPIQIDADSQPTTPDADTKITSLSDDDEDDDFEAKEDLATNLNDEQRRELDLQGYCTRDPLDNLEVVNTVRGFIRQHVARDFMLRDVLCIIVDFYHWRFNTDVFVEVVCASQEAPTGREYLVVPRRNLTLSRLLSNSAELGCLRIELDKVRGPIMRQVLRYLHHHRGRTPATIAKPIRSVNMKRICEDPWDAELMDACSRKAVFQIILAANYLDCPSLLHLGCAKIATLIKGKSPEEIRTILADNE